MLMGFSAFLLISKRPANLSSLTLAFSSFGHLETIKFGAFFLGNLFMRNIVKCLKMAGFSSHIQN